MAQLIQDIKRKFSRVVLEEEEKGVTLKNQSINAPATGTKAVVAIVLAPKDEEGAWVTGEEELVRIEDEPSLGEVDPVLANLATLLQLTQFMSKVNTSHPQVGGFAAYLKAKYKVDISVLTVWDLAKVLDPILPQLIEAQKEALKKLAEDAFKPAELSSTSPPQ